MLLCFSSSHRTADFDLLERLERSAPAVTAALAEHSELVAGSVVVATCNRFEAYLDIDDPLPSARAVSSETVIDAVSAASGIPADELRTSSTVYCDHSVAEHLFAVSSGLESVVVGEGEIAGQVRRSLESARASGTVTSELERLFQVASRTSRGVKNRTGIMTAGRSMVRLALDLAESRISDWSQTRVLLVGTGKYAGASLAALRDKGADDVRVHSASGRAAKFALSHDVRPVVEGGLLEALARADLVVTCTTVTDYVLTRELLADALAQPGAAERRLVVDLGLPRNVDPTVAELDGVELLDLETISIHAPLEELSAADDARSIVGKAAAEFAAQTAEQAVTPALVALRKHVFDVLDAEIERARSRGADEQTEVALRHLAGVLLHTPSVRARELARSGDADAFVAGAAALFGLEIEAAAARPRLSAVDDETAAS
ncbi:glutamyl-tRNA reductase [Leifsonia sp. ZF2019]|uniref:glutamyl-tRNA reductase n=1 Tax=Leifsonia sp. ZF2019 TaxID=2781978 RepID=UPI001CBCDFAE|nr:glutamyl-tRNA reductase [Leifsonia sp. ZF2019]UAJ79662.1 glutamyl-tRNA reductase [Leifsonia sp. ZF2019]